MMLPEWLDSNIGKMLATVIPASAIGTLWRAIITPRENVIEMAKGAFISISVGSVVGGAAMQYFNLDGFVAAAVVSTAAYLADHTLGFFETRGKRLREGVIDTSLKGDGK